RARARARARAAKGCGADGSEPRPGSRGDIVWRPEHEHEHEHEHEPESERIYPSSTSAAPSSIACPGVTLITVTFPSPVASTGISIFIDSRITTVCPSVTLSPTATSIFHTVQAM